MKKAILLFTISGIVIPLMFGGCNFATHSFNNGKLLEPGETMTTISVGARSGYKINGGDTSFFGSYYIDSLHSYHWIPENTIITKKDTSFSSNLSIAFDWRLGVLSTRPFGKGLEVGFLIEAPVQFFRTVEYLPLLQFDGRFGLPAIPTPKYTYNQDFAIGWILGQWVDNSWFIEYAGGFEYRSATPYFNARITRVATDVNAANASFGDTAFLTIKKNTWNFRACAGVSLKLPHRPILPDYIVPEVALFFPSPTFRIPGISGHIGMRWLDDK